MKKREKNKERLHVKRWGVGKTIAVIISSLAFIVGMAILGVYLGNGIGKENQILPESFSFNELNDPNFNVEKNRLEISGSTFTLTITSPTQNITSKKVSLNFSQTIFYDDNINDFNNDGSLGITTNNIAGTISNGVITIPQTVEIGVPFTVVADVTNKNGYEWIRGGISTITATATLSNGVASTKSLTIVVDTPVYETETVLVNAAGEEVTISELTQRSNVVEEEYFYAKTKFYPYESQFVFCDKDNLKISYYQLGNVQDENIASTTYLNKDEVSFYAGQLLEGGYVESFTAKNSKIYQTIKQNVESIGYQESDYTNIYRKYINQYANYLKSNPEEISNSKTYFDIVQATINEFKVSNSGQTFELNNEQPLAIYINNNPDETLSEFLGVEIVSSNGTTLNNVLENVVLSFSYNGEDPTNEENGFISIQGGEKVLIDNDDTVYYRAFFEEGQIDNNLGKWSLSLNALDKFNEIIQVKVSLLVKDGDKYKLFSNKEGVVQRTISVKLIEHVEDTVSWTSTEDKEGYLSYDEGATTPNPAKVSLAGLTSIPETNIYKTIKYFVYFANLEENEAKAMAAKMFGDADLDYAGFYTTNEGERYLIPVSTSNDELSVKEAGEFKLYFATINGVTENLYQIAKMVDTPINVKVTKPLYTSSLSSAQITYFNNNELNPNYDEITAQKYMPTKTDSLVEDKIKVSFTINADSIEIFNEKFNLGLISLKIYSGEQDITNYFKKEDNGIIEDNLLSYVLSANSTWSTETDLQITSVEIVYQENEANQIWNFNNIYSGGNISLYTPSAESIDFANNAELNNGFNIVQTLGTDGEFTLNITSNGQTYTKDALLDLLKENIEIVDQKGNKETLKNSWNFVSSSELMKIAENGQDFVFNNGNGEALLSVKIGEKQSAKSINFTISAQGITDIQVDKNNQPGEQDLESININESSATVSKYGANGSSINLNDIIKFYVDDGEGGKAQYTNVVFMLDSGYLAGLDQSSKEELFGENGIIKINGTAVEDISTLSNLVITSLKFNYNFAQDHIITFKITDNANAVNFTLKLNILNNVNVSTPSLVNDVKANVAVNLSENDEVVYNVDNQSGEIYFPTKITGGIYTTTYYIVEKDNEYYLSTQNTNAIGEMTNGEIKFYHFFTSDTKSFVVNFQPEGDNKYTTDYKITFNVAKNINVSAVQDNNISAFESGTLNLSSYIKVTEISSQQDATGISISYEFDNDGTNYLTISQNSQFTVAENVRFDYGQTSLTQKVKVTLTQGNEKADYYVYLNIVLPSNFFEGLTNSFVDESGLKPSHQIVNKTNNYLVFEADSIYTISNISLSGQSFAISPSTSDGDNSLNNYYTLINSGTKVLYINTSNNMLLGFGDENVYTLLTFSLNNKTVVVALPTIISQIGTKFVKYEKSPSYNSLNNAIMTPKELLKADIYTTITAGNVYNLKDFINIPTEASVVTLTEQSVPSESGCDILPNTLLKFYNESTYEFTLNHLSDEFSNAYFAVFITIKISEGKEVTFNYLFKVAPNVTVEKANYPYNGTAEYIEVENGSTFEINLDEPFGNDTLKYNENRFVIKSIYGTDPSSIANAENTLYEDRIVSVKITVDGEEKVFTDENGWLPYIQFLGFSKNENGQSILNLYLKTATTLEFVVARNYVGGSETNELSIIGGEIEYKFIINYQSNYLVKVDSQTINKDGLYQWTLNNWQIGQAQTSRLTSEEKTIYLINRVGTTDNIVFDKMKFNLNDLEGWTIEDNTAMKDELTFSFEYNTSNAKFTVTYPEYLSKDYNFTGTLYTETGKIATIEFIFKADSQYEIVSKTFNGGKSIGVNEIFKIYTSSNPTAPATDFTLNSINVTGSLIGFVEKGDNTNTINLASVINGSVSGNIEFNVTLSDGKAYSFTIENFTIEANLTAEDVRIDNVIAGTDTPDSYKSLVKEALTTNNEIVYSWSTDSAAIVDKTGSEVSDFSITTAQVGSVTEVVIPVTIKVKAIGEESVYTTKTINVTIVIYPSVELEPNYPVPADEELTVEYIENNTSFENFGTDFLNSNAPFAQEERIGVSYAYIDENDKVVKYNKESSIDITKTVTIKSLTNAVIKQNDSTTSLKVNDKIDLSGKLTFARGTSGGTSQVVLSISYNNVVVDYTIEIVDSLYNVLINTASNNTTADETGEYEAIYVDKTSSSDLFAKNRMLEATLLSGASKGDYYIFFEDKTISTTTEAKVLNLAETFVNEKRNQTIYLDLGVSGLQDISSYNVYMWVDSLYKEAEENGAEDKFAYLKENYSSRNLFSPFFGSASLTSRIVLTYNNIEVNYANYADDLKYNDNTLSETPLDIPVDATLGVVNNISTFTFESKTFNISYRYMPDIDISVSISADIDGYVTVEAKQSISLVEEFGVRRKTTNELIEKDEMINNNATFNLSVSNENQVSGAVNEKYLSVTANTSITNPSVVYDWTITGDGACNNGNYVSMTLSYTIGGFTKDFNIKVKVISDYQFDFAGNTNVSYEDGNIVSNIDDPIIINNSDISSDGSTYNDIILAGLNGELSVKHGNDPTTELSVKAFNYSMTQGVKVENISYNVAENITSKLNFGAGDNKNNWVQNETKTVWTWEKGSNDSLTLNRVKIVNFGSQYYKLVAKDVYGYTFYLYFTLSSGNEDPSIYTSDSATLSLVEGQTVAFGARYQTLSVTVESQSESESVITKNLSIDSNWQEPEDFTTAEGKVIKIQNLEAWGFDSVYTGVEYGYFTVDDSSDGYTLNNTSEVKYQLVDSSAENYLTLPNFKDVKVTAVVYYYNGQEIGAETYNNSISTNSSLQHSQEGIYLSPESCSLNLPTIYADKTWIYGDENNQIVQMTVTLKYTDPMDSENVEYYEMTTEIQLSKTSTITEKLNQVADNISFNLKNFVNVEDNGIKIEDYEIYDDTLAVAVNASSSTTFTLVYGGNKKQVEIHNTGNNYNKLHYISLSETFETVLSEGAEITIEAISGNATFYYNNNQVANNQITVASITNETIRVSNYQELRNNNQSSVTQYYIVKWGEGESAKAYRYTHVFNVSGTYKSVECEYLDYNYTLPQTYGIEIPISTWAENITYTQVRNGIEIANNLLTEYDGDNLYFVITSDATTGTGGTGLASINSQTGAITLKDGFDENNYATVEIYQKVSGVDGTYGQSGDVLNMQHLASIKLKLGAN